MVRGLSVSSIPCGLVQEEQTGIIDQFHGDGEPFALAAGEMDHSGRARIAQSQRPHNAIHLIPRQSSQLFFN